jgi:hypothetical protein
MNPGKPGAIEAPLIFSRCALAVPCTCGRKAPSCARTLSRAARSAACCAAMSG